MTCQLFLFISCLISTITRVRTQGTIDCTFPEDCNVRKSKLLMAPGYGGIDYIDLQNIRGISALRTDVDITPESLAVDSRNYLVYSTSHIDGKNSQAVIYRTYVLEFNKFDYTLDFQGTEMFRPSSLSYDWIAQNIYFVDNFNKIVACYYKEPARCGIVYSHDSDVISGLAVHPNAGIMFWSVTGPNKRIMASYMDGSCQQAIITTGISNPQTIIVDEFSSRIYWSDVGKGTIEASDLDGSNRKLITVAKDAYAMALFEETLYWFELNNNKFMMADKFGVNKSEICGQFMSDRYPRRYTAFLIMDHSVQPTLRDNNCQYLDCDHICALSGPDGASCLCKFESNSTINYEQSSLLEQQCYIGVPSEHSCSLSKQTCPAEDNDLYTDDFWFL